MKRTICMLMTAAMLTGIPGMAVWAQEPDGAAEAQEENLSEEKTAEEGMLAGELPNREDELVGQEITIQNNVLISNNAGKNEYRWNWTTCMDSYLTVNEDGSYTRVEAAGDGYIYIENYSAGFQLLSCYKLQRELPLFGGFYDDGSCFYIVFGQTNEEENNSKEVCRVVKYSRSWQRLDAASVCGANTTEPFGYGSLRMDAHDGYLYIRTSHLMYASKDGLKHQANMTMEIRISDMSVNNILYTVLNSSRGYVSHSFNQFIKVDDETGTLYALDHGDSYPRSAVLFRYRDTNFGKSPVSEVHTLKYAGRTGDNYTGATLGGFEISDYACLTAGSSVPQDGNGGSANIYVTATLKDDFTESGTAFYWITNHSNDGWQIGNPQLVEINKNKYLLLWTEKNGAYNQVKYLYLDGYGRALGAVESIEGTLSDCQPIYDPRTHRVIWYATDGNSLHFYTIDQWPFSDVEENPGNWRYDNVKYVNDSGIMTGVKSDEFQPDVSLTRSQFASVIYRMAGSPQVDYENIFTDVAAGKWYSSAIIWAYENGIVAGLGGGRFGIDENITREQMARMLMEYAKVREYDISERADFGKFEDASQVSGWAAENMRWAVGSGIISGSTENGKYYMNPKGEAKRVECAVMLTKFLQKYE